jgi:hypothetical protein
VALSFAVGLAFAGHAVAFQTPWPTTQAVSDTGRFLAWSPPPPVPVGVCIVDSGVNLNPDTESSVVFRTALDTGAPGDVAGDEHGTLMAMFAAAPANIGWGMIGAAPNAIKIISVRVAQPRETGEGLDYFPAGITECLRYQHTYNIKVISLSLGSAPPEFSPQAALNEQITVAHNYGINVVAAAGNDSGPLEYPADDPTVLSVGAMNSAHQLCSFSSIGARLIAPGCELDAADPKTGIPNANYSQGTSQADATAAAVLGALRAYRPDLTPEQAEQLLTEPDNGILNVTATFQAAELQNIIQAGTETEPPNTTSAPLPTSTQPASPAPSPRVAGIGPVLTVRLPRPHAHLYRRAKHLLLVLTARPAEAEAQLQLLGRTGRSRTLHHLRELTSRKNTVLLPAKGILAVRVRYIDLYDATRASAWAQLQMPSSTM